MLCAGARGAPILAPLPASRARFSTESPRPKRRHYAPFRCCTTFCFFLFRAYALRNFYKNNQKTEAAHSKSRHRKPAHTGAPRGGAEKSDENGNERLTPHFPSSFIFRAHPLRGILPKRPRLLGQKSRRRILYSKSIMSARVTQQPPCLWSEAG